MTFIPEGLDLLISGINSLWTVNGAAWCIKCEGPAIGRGCLILLTDLIIRRGGKLVCQVFSGFKLFGWCWLRGIWGFEGLDKKTGVRGKKEQGRGYCGG